MATVKGLLLALCMASTAAGSLLPGGDHHHTGHHNSMNLGDVALTKPGEPLQPLALQQPPVPPPAQLPQLYFPPPTSGGAQIAVKPVDEFVPLSSGPPGGLGGSSVPDAVEPDFGGWIPMTSSSSPGHQSTSQTGGEHSSSSASFIGQQPSDTEFTQGSSSFGQQSQLQSQAGGGESGFSLASGSSSSSTQEELLTNAWSQAPAAQTEGGHGGLAASYVPPSSESGGFSEGDSVPAELKPLNAPQPGRPHFPQSSPQTFVGNPGPFSSSLSSSAAEGQFSGEHTIPETSLKPLGLPQPENVPSQFLSPNGGDTTGVSFSNVQSSSGSGEFFSQASETEGGPSQVPLQPDSGDINLPPSYVPPTPLGGISFPQGNQVSTDVKPLDLPQTGGFPQSSFHTEGGNNQTPSPGGDHFLGNERPVSIELKPLGLPQPGNLLPQQTSQTSGESTSTLTSSYVPPSSGNTGLTSIEPTNLPHAEELSQSSFETEGAITGPPFSSSFGNLQSGGGLSTQEGSTSVGSSTSTQESVPAILKPLGLPQTEPIQTSLKPLGLPQPAEQSVQAFLKPLGLPQPEEQPDQTFLKPLSSQQPYEQSVQTSLKPLGLPQPEEQPVQISLKPLGLPQQEQSVQTFLKPLDLPQQELQPVQTSLKPLGLPQPEEQPAQTFLKPLGLPQPEEQSIQISLKPLGLPQSEEQPVQSLKPLNLPQTGPATQPALELNNEQLAPSYVPPPSEGEDSFSQGGSISTELKPLGLPQASGSPPQSSSHSSSDNAQQGKPVATVLKPFGLPEVGQSLSSQSESQQGGTDFGVLSTPYQPPSTSEEGGGFFAQGSVITGGSAPFDFQQGSSGNSAPSPPSHIEPQSENGNSFSEGVTATLGSVSTLLRPLGLPPTIGSSSESSAQFSTGSSSTSYNPSTQEGGPLQIASSSGESSSQFTSQATGGISHPTASYQSTSISGESFSTSGQGGALAPSPVGSPFAGGVQALLRPLDLPLQTEPEQNFIQPGPPSVETVDDNQSSSSSAPAYVENKPLFSTETTGDNKPFSLGVSQGGPIEASSAANSQSLSEYGGNSEPQAPQTSEPVYQPEIPLGVAASGAVGSTVPFPRPPVENKPLGLPESVIQPSSNGGPADFGAPEPPPSLVIDEQFLTGPSGGPSVASAPGIPFSGTGGQTGSGSNGGSNGGGGGSAASGSIANNGGSGGPVEILSQTFKIDENGNYEYSYEQSDGQAVQESGEFTPGNERETGSLASTGGFRYRGTDGRQYDVEYTADERGFLPTGDHLPTPPPQIAAYAELRKRYPGLFWAEKLRVRDPEE